MQRLLHPLFWLLAALPAVWLVWAAWRERLGFVPIETAIHHSGRWALWGLLAVLALGVVLAVVRVAPLLVLRRVAGLTAFGYAVLHVGLYFGGDLGWAWALLWEDLRHRHHVWAGLAALLLLLPLALTSGQWLRQRLGSPRWTWLHRLVWPATALAVVHYALLQRGGDLRTVWWYGGVLVLLLLLRLVLGRRDQPG